MTGNERVISGTCQTTSITLPFVRQVAFSFCNNEVLRFSCNGQSPTAFRDDSVYGPTRVQDAFERKKKGLQLSMYALVRTYRNVTLLKSALLSLSFCFQLQYFLRHYVFI